MGSMEFSAEWDMESFMGFLESRLPVGILKAAKQAAGVAAIRLQNMMREDLMRYIYDTPESPSYKRTWTLYRATYASRPGGDHSGDEAAAFGGYDLARSIGAPLSTAFAVIEDGIVEIEIGAWTHYAGFVHDGLGGGDRQPRPFTVRAAAASNGIMEEEITKTLEVEVLLGLR